MRHLFRLIFAMALATACDESRSDRVGSFPKRGAANDTNSVARKVGEIQDLHAPESVKYDSLQDVFFISNIQGVGSARDDRGFIVRVSAAAYGNSEIFAESGRNGVQLHAPKGMALQGDTLWVADIDVLRGFHRRTGAPVATVDFRAHNAVLLNDIALGPDGALYITDTGIIMSPKGVLHPGGEKIFRLSGRTIETLRVSPPVGWPNGITWDPRGKRWLVVTFDPFASELNSISHGEPVSTKRGLDTTRLDSAKVRAEGHRTKLAGGIGRFDGVEVMADGRILVSAWSDSSIHSFADGKDQKIIRHLSQPADIGLDTRRNRIAIPLVMMDRVQFWEIAPRTETLASLR